MYKVIKYANFEFNKLYIMKNKLKNVFVVLFFFSIFIACSGDDDSTLELIGVPTGEIVAVELRQEVLTGFSNGAGSQKWWTHVTSSVDFSSTECGDDQEYNNQGYYAFYASGEYYYKTSTNGSETLVGTWAWEDSSKSKMIISNQSGSAVNTVTYLNADNVVFGSNQSSGGCSAITFEQFNNPF